MSEKSKLSIWIDENFGDQDGSLTIKDLFKDAPSIALIVADIVMLAAEYRVFMVGMVLTNNDWMLAVGFILVSSTPFYLGQILFVYNSANGKQQAIAVALILMGLAVSGYYGMADYLHNGGLSINAETAFTVAVYATIALILLGMVYALADDKIASKRRLNKLNREANDKMREMDTREKLLNRYEKLQGREQQLEERYGTDAVLRINRNQFNQGERAMATDIDQKGLDPNAQSQR